MMSPFKSRYRSLCKIEKTIPVFLNDWWLDAVCGEQNWDVALAENKDEINGALPYCFSNRFGFRLLRMPKLTGFLGPWIKYPDDQKYATKLSYEMDVFRSLIDALPQFDFFRLRFHYSVTNWMPFYWKGFEQTTRYTYIIGLDNIDAVFNGFKSSVRGKIRKASEIISVSDDRPLTDFYRLFCMTFERQKVKSPVSFDYLNRIDLALADKKQRKIFYAVDAEGLVHSALYLIWDNQSAYLLMLGEDPALRNSGAGIFLVWEAIKFTKNELALDKFDFLGSMIEPIETVRRSFGAKQTPYFQLQKFNSKLLRLGHFLIGRSTLT